MTDTIWADDVLGRKSVASDLERLISFGPSVIDIDAPYGSGKTFLLTRLKEQLSQSGYHCISIDAWGSDFHTEPVLMLFSEFTEQLMHLGLIPKKSSLAKSAKAVGKSLLKRGVPAVVKVGTLGVVDLKDMSDELAKAQTEAIAEAAGNISGDLVKEYTATKRSIEEFKAALTAAVATLRGTSIADKTRLVVIVDELDRCRPDYALQILELVKHLFLVDGIAFVLGADMKVLARSVNAAYGIGTDVPGYLGRLIDYTVPLASGENHPELFADHLVKLLNLQDGNKVARMFAACTRIWLPSLRDQARAMKTIGVMLAMKLHLGAERLDATVALLCWKLYAPEFYEQYINGNIPLEDLISHLTASLKKRSAAEISALYLAVTDRFMSSRILVIATLLGLQMVDDRTLRFVIEGETWGGWASPNAIAVFGNQGAQLQKWAMNSYDAFKKIDKDLYQTMPLRLYMDSELTILS